MGWMNATRHWLGFSNPIVCMITIIIILYNRRAKTVRDASIGTMKQNSGLKRMAP